MPVALGCKTFQALLAKEFGNGNKMVSVYEARQYPRLSSAASHELANVVQSDMASHWPNTQIQQWVSIQSHPHSSMICSENKPPFQEAPLARHCPNNGCPLIALQNLHNSEPVALHSSNTNEFQISKCNN